MTPLPNNHFAVQGKEGSEFDERIAPNNGLFLFHHTRPIRTATRFQLPTGQWGIVGLAKDLTYDQKREILGDDHEKHTLEALLVSKGVQPSTALIIKQKEKV